MPLSKDDIFNLGTLRGQRAELAPLALEHAPALALAAKHGRERYTLTGVPRDEDDATAYVEAALAERAKRASVPFAIIDRARAVVVGSTRFCHFEYWHWKPEFRTRPADLPDAVQIGGTWLALEAQRTGINREVKLLMLDVAFESWGLVRVRLRTDRRNQRSRDAIEGIGAHFDGILRADSAGYDGSIRDSAAFSILASEWADVRPRLQASLGDRG